MLQQTLKNYFHPSNIISIYQTKNSLYEMLCIESAQVQYNTLGFLFLRIIVLSSCMPPKMADKVEVLEAKALCIRCGDNFHPLHKFSEKHLSLLVLEDDDDNKNMLLECCKTMEECGGIASHTGTMKLEGKLNGVSVLVLVDSGASLNFISPQVVAALELAVTPIRKLGVQLANGHRVLTRGKCVDVSIYFGNVDVRIDDAYVLKLGSVDVVLGVAWLRTLGKVVMDWGEMTMSFLHKGSSVELKGKLENAVMPHTGLNTEVRSEVPELSFEDKVVVLLGDDSDGILQGKDQLLHPSPVEAKVLKVYSRRKKNGRSRGNL